MNFRLGRTARSLLLFAAFFTGAAIVLPHPVLAGSCCGGAGGNALVLPSFYRSMIDVSVDTEIYDGYWDQRGVHRSDPPGSDLRQYRLNISAAQRLSPQWQASILVPYVWNDNTYSGLSSRTDGPGDLSLSMWYEAMQDLTAWRVRSLSDLRPQVLIGASLLVPTGISPYDDVSSSFDITGRGFYRLDGTINITKTINPWIASCLFSYGTYLERSVNREHGNYVEPYRKKLGDRMNVSLSLGYILYLGTGGDTLTSAVSISDLREGDTEINGIRDPSSGFRKDSLGAMITYSSTDHDWSIRAGWNHAIPYDGWGYNFPTTDIYTLGVSHGFR